VIFAILSDIHANLEALEAAFNSLKAVAPDAVFCTGDIVGYAANPNEVVELLREHKVRCVMGNHDFTTCNLQAIRLMNRNAAEAVLYTDRVISDANRHYLKELPFYLDEEDFYLVHGLPPASVFEYIHMTDNYDLRMAFRSFRQQVAFVGHTHLFGIYELNPDDDIRIYPIGNHPFNLKDGYRYLINAGSIGQPRDADLRSGYLVYDTEKREVTKHLIQYNVQLTVRKIEAAGLPGRNGKRLLG
jgi:predicted phosphodiesterase